ncbi:DUF4351 domain-containing protein [Nostoc muscorum FACHB-395]|uniref:DUF4351 domain-containing protein n=1 Tax=Nostoc sp. C057 TaxID=2576903 RepID=UPI0015C2F794|nr:DUF4351 domain-containing protein [Desmonostoc muscorum FACHB-395]QLE52188.1 DUF4351 domain-containing protein [Nostoc sp. C057]
MGKRRPSYGGGVVHSFNSKLKSLTQLEDLSEALLDFSTSSYLTKWLNNAVQI